MDSIAANLRYIDAGHLTIAAGDLNGASVVGQSAGTLGTLAGALVDPGQRSICYLVVESRHWLKKHRYLLLLVDSANADLRELTDEERFVPFSDDDLMTALFTTRAA